ncbi:hypothetical protein O1R50_10635 [Glycomyces luteolus]|uniref:Transposase (putative) YhgA-like domain-containing protein n=1 Tax=Glycomyces luteolus TaxID=2670330 RepID=A0A9X3P8J1_9ACTN|nr:hypothetical protein [Glycomyces luteolus]MDA1360084.1 hypothetical protein [Glycomyces luteolus]
MPGEFHEILVKLIQDEPASVPWMLALAGGPRGARWVLAETRSGAVGSPGPTERGADAVVRLGFADGSESLVVCVVQHEWSEDEYHRLPGYVARAFEDHRIPVVPLMLCRTDALARRFRRGISTGPDSILAVATVGPANMPDLGSDEAPPNAAAAVAAAVMRRQPKTIPTELFVSTLDRWLGTIEPGRAAGYATFLLTTLAKEPASLLEALMKTEARRYHSEYTEELLARGREEGRGEGAVRHARATLLRMLEADGEVGDQRRAEVAACADLGRLDAWITDRIRPAKG